MNSSDIAMVAGEASGDLLASLIIPTLRKQLEQNCKKTVSLIGIGGARMIEQGFDAWYSSDQLAVRGYAEVLRHYWGLLKIRQHLKKRLLAKPPAAFIGIDAPDFNLDLEIDLRQAGIPTIHFISPSIWAWRAERINKIRAAVSHMLVVLPFEVEIYRTQGIPVTYVGHPLAQTIALKPDQLSARQQLGIKANQTVLAVLPGSRSAEIKYIAPTFIASIKALIEQRPELVIVLPCANPQIFEQINLLLKTSWGSKDLPPNLIVLNGLSHQAMAAANAVLVASGTATLEAALFKRPMVIAYRMAPLSWYIMKNMGYQPWVGLPNILAKESLVPEFLQNNVCEKNLLPAINNALDNDKQADYLYERFTEMHLSLLQDTPTLASQAIVQTLSA